MCLSICRSSGIQEYFIQNMNVLTDQYGWYNICRLLFHLMKSRMCFLGREDQWWKNNNTYYAFVLTVLFSASIFTNLSEYIDLLIWRGFLSPFKFWLMNGSQFSIHFFVFVERYCENTRFWFESSVMMRWSRMR